MIGLPPALASWESYLRLFPDAELIAALAPLAQRLDAALGPMRTRDRVDEGDPDGFSDICRRGPYDRLLLSEWLLADEAPDEFLRRAAMGEHGFLQLARRTRSGGRVSFALFDAGPSQIGGPRIAHLALLIVLARRAEAAKARFEWAIVQRPDDEPNVGLTESRIRALLTARTSLAPTDAMWDRWRERAAAQSDVDDFWTIGGERLARLAARDGAASVLVRDELGLETNEVSAHVHRPGRADARLVLALPDDALCARLLRDPFAVATGAAIKTHARVAPASNLIFTPSGGKLIARAQAGGLISYPVPNSPRAAPGYPKQYLLRTGDRVISAGRIGKFYVVVTRPGGGNTLLVSCVGGKGGSVPVGGYTLREAQRQELDRAPDMLASCFAQTPRRESHLACGLPTGEILNLSHLKGNPQMTTLAAHADLFALAPKDVFVYGYRTPNQWVLQAPSAGETGLSYKLDYDGAPGRSIVSGYGAALTNRNFGLIAAQKDDTHWTVLTDGGEVTLTAISGCRVVGVIADHSHSGPAFVLLEPGERRLRILGADWSHVLPVADSAIVQVTVSHAAALIAYSTADGEVILYSLDFETILYQLKPSEGDA